MALKDTINHMKNLLDTLSKDLDKATGGNKAASQRVRTCSIKLEKVAKMYRKESVSSERKGGGKASKAKAPARKAAKGAKKAPAKKAKRR